MNDSQERKSGAVLSYVVIIVNTLIQLLYTPLLIRKLGQSEYGLYSLVASIIGYLTIMDLGFGNAIIVYTSKYRACARVLQAHLTISAQKSPRGHERPRGSSCSREAERWISTACGVI